MRNNDELKNITPTPWRWSLAGGNMSENYSQSHAISEYGKSNLIAGCFSDVKGGEETARQNAEFIVEACNSYKKLKAENEKLHLVFDAVKKYLGSTPFKESAELLSKLVEQMKGVKL